MNRYPKLVIDEEAIKNNVRLVKSILDDAGIKLSVVTKGFSSLPRLAKAVDSINPMISDSRIETIKGMRDAGIKAHIALLRVPMMSEAEDVITHCDMSVQVDKTVVTHYNDVAKKMGKVHDVMLMFDVGDLREGPFYLDEFLELGEYVEKELSNIHIKGVGTEFACYGSLVPNAENTKALVDAVEALEERIGRQIEWVSGGATSGIPLVLQGIMPKRVNHLRVGEAINSVRELEELWDTYVDGFKPVFSIEAEVCEVRSKPTAPKGELIQDCFGNKPEYEDRGVRKRAIIAIGRKDLVAPTDLIPEIEGLEILGGSSDLTILDIEDCKQEIKPGDIIKFGVHYVPMLFSIMTDVYKEYR